MSDTTSSQYSITLRLTEAQQQWLVNTAETLSKLSGHPVAHSAVVMRLMELGAPLLMENINSKHRESTKTSSHLRLIHKE